MHQVHFCSGSVFVTGDRIAMSLLRYVQIVAQLKQSDLVAVPVLTSAGKSGTVTIMVNGVSQISADSFEYLGTELEDDEFVRRLDESSDRLNASVDWLGLGDPSPV